MTKKKAKKDLKKKGGPRTSMTPARVNRMLALVRESAYPDCAARVAGIPPSTMRSARASNPRFAKVTRTSVRKEVGMEGSFADLAGSGQRG